MTEPTRGTRARRGNRGPGSLLLTALLVLAIVASSMLVFTDRVELLKLAVIVALWAAVVAAFVSFIYRRQSDIDQAKSRDLKLVYDLQLDREISARREYELSIESQLRRELASELRAETSDEVAALRAELAALRANLEIIFDTDLQSRPALEGERTTVHTFGDWDAVDRGTAKGQSVPAPDRDERSIGPGRVISSRIDTEAADDFDPSTEESPIIDVPAEPQPPEVDWAAQDPGGAHRRASERESVATGWSTPRQESPMADAQQEVHRRAPEPGRPPFAPPPEVRLPWMPVESSPSSPPPPPTAPPPRQEPERVARHSPAGNEWRPAPAEGQYIPAGRPGSNWAAPAADPDTAVPTAEQAPPPPPVVEPPVVEPPVVEPPVVEPPVVEPPVVETAPDETPPVLEVPVVETPPDGPPHETSPTEPPPPPPTDEPKMGRHYPAETAASESARRARHSSDADPGRPAPPPTLATPAPVEAPEPASARHRGADDDAEESAGQHIGGQPVSELMARLQVSSTGGGRRRRRDE